MIFFHSISAFLITGGRNSKGGKGPTRYPEIYVPSRNLSCRVTSPIGTENARHGEGRGKKNHIQVGLMACGHPELTCVTWDPKTGTWPVTHNLTLARYEERLGKASYAHWTPRSGTGTYLMGGYQNERQNVLVKPDGSEVLGFDLKYDTVMACGIDVPENDTVVVTGGGDGSIAVYYERPQRGTPTSRVTVYNENGWVRDLPNLLTARVAHSCTSFLSEGKRVNIQDEIHCKFLLIHNILASNSGWWMVRGFVFK